MLPIPPHLHEGMSPHHRLSKWHLGTQGMKTMSHCATAKVDPTHTMHTMHTAPLTVPLPIARKRGERAASRRPGAGIDPVTDCRPPDPIP